MNENFIADVFSTEHGDIELNDHGKPKIKIYSDHGQSKGECTIAFRNDDVAKRIIDTYNGKKHLFNKIHIIYLKIMCERLIKC